MIRNAGAATLAFARLLRSILWRAVASRPAPNRRFRRGFGGL